MYVRFVLLTLLTLVTSFSFSQLSKAEKKKWKAEMKKVGVEGYKDMSERNNSLISENRELKSDISDFKKTAREASERLTICEAEKDSLSLQWLRRDSVISTDGIRIDTSSNVVAQQKYSNVVFKVQIGAYKKFDLSAYFNNHRNFGGEIDDDGTMKYTLGIFTDYKEAETFKGLMREMGVKGAWIVSYKNGKRIDMAEALNEMSNN